MLLFSGLNFLTAQAQSVKNNNGNFTGKVTDKKSKTTVAGALVRIASLKRSTYTNTDGMFTFNNVLGGTHIVEVSYTGWDNAVATVTVNGDVSSDFELSETIAENETVVVTGVPNASLLKNNPISVSSLRKNQLMAINGSSLADALTTLKGVTNITTGPAITKPVIRGLGYNRAVAVNDGIRQEGQQWGDEHGLEIDEYSVKKVELLRGPGNIMYGSDAMGGVINITTMAPAPEGTLRGNLMYHHMMNNSQHGFYGDIEGNQNGFFFGFKAGGRGAGDYNNRADGNVLNSRFNERNIGGYAGIDRKWGQLTFFMNNFDQQLGIVEGGRDDDGKFVLYKGTPFEVTATPEILNSRSLYLPRQKVYHFKAGIDNILRIGKARLHTTVGYQSNQRREFENPAEPSEVALGLGLNTYTLNTTLNLPINNGWSTAIGLTGMNQKNEFNGGEEKIIPNYTTNDAGAFVFIQKQAGRSTVSGGVRYDYRSFNSIEDLANNFAANKTNFGNISGSLGFSFNATQALTFKANVARGFRAPNAAELSSFGAHAGTNRFEIGNGALKSETSIQADVAVEVNTDHFSLGISPFYNRINNYIFFGKLDNAAGGDSLQNVDGEDLNVFKFQQDRAANFSGFEVSADIHPHPLDWLHWENTISIVRGRFGSRQVSNLVINDNVPFVPAARWNSELRAQVRKAGDNMRNAYFKIAMERLGDQDNIYSQFNTETRTDGVTLWHIGMGSDLHFNDHHVFTVHAGVNNVGNAIYQNHLSRLKYTDVNQATGRQGVFNMGQNFYVKVNMPIDFKRTKAKMVEPTPMPILPAVKDTDGDGINDNEDNCVNVPGVAKYKGCPVPDTDGDGINDDEDNCVKVPGVVKYKGCPVPDTDGDGLNDDEDNCPYVAGPKDNKGCPEEKTISVEEKMDDVQEQVDDAAKNILFETGSSTIKKSSYKDLDKIAELLKNDETMSAVVEGHTDNKGNDVSNQKLSERRANAVKQYLTKRGVAASRITTQGFGETQPIDSNETAEGRANNRRVEIKLGM
jgi:iron complex outermembrane recepter protein